MSPSGERQPLLKNASEVRPAHAQNTGNRSAHQAMGPLEISQMTRARILAGVFLGTFLTSLNMTLVPTMLPAISSQFNKANQGSWLGTAFLLATCTFTPLYGRLCDVLGRRGACQVALLLSGFGVLACGCSGNMHTLIAARFLGGMGAGGLTTTCQIIVGDMYSMRSRALTQGFASMFQGIGLGLGGPIGGLITDKFGWRWAFLFQLPLFVLSFMLTSCNLIYVTPGKGKNAAEVFERIDYGGSATLLATVASILIFLSTRYNEGHSWSDASVYIPFTLSFVFFLCFLAVEIYIAPEPVLAPYLLKQKIPVLVGISNFLVATCNFSVTYFFPMWFQTVGLTNAAVAGSHLLPNSISMSLGSLFAGWMMHRTGTYKTINLVFGFLPSIAMLCIQNIKEDSGWFQSWFSVMPLGFGNAVVLQTLLMALMSHLPNSMMAVGTGFGQLFRGVGQVAGVAISSAIFQSTLDRELNARIRGPGAAEMIDSIRHSTSLVATLPPDLQRAARDSYAVSLHAVFVFASCSTFFSYFVRLGIPDKKLENAPHRGGVDHEARPAQNTQTLSDSDSDDDSTTRELPPPRRASIESVDRAGCVTIDGTGRNYAS